MRAVLTFGRVSVQEFVTNHIIIPTYYHICKWIDKFEVVNDIRKFCN